MTNSLNSSRGSRLVEMIRKIDPVLLVFLLLVTYVSLAVKLLAIIFIYVMRPNFKFGLRSGRIPVFYLVMAALAALSLLLYAERGTNYIALAGLIIVFWGASFLITHQLKLAVERSEYTVITNTLSWFFIINAIVSLLNLFAIMLEIDSINPYIYTGKNMKFFDSTGDFIRGASFDISTVNMIINSFGIFFFLYRRRFALSAMTVVVAMLTTSNLGNIILVFFFLAVLVFDRSRFNKSIIICYLAFFIIFISKISPSNLNYLNNRVKSFFQLEKPLYVKIWHDETEKNNLVKNYLSSREKKSPARPKEELKIRTLIKQKQYTKSVARVKEDTLYKLKELDSRSLTHKTYISYYGDTLDRAVQLYYNKRPGKIISMIETIEFAQQSPKNLLLGAGAGNFSSKLAFKASNIGVAGKYVERYKYVAPEFRDSHFKITLQYLMKPIGEHSVINFPNSVFNQLLGEYGLIGFLCFLLLYVWFFLKRFFDLTYGRVLLPMCMAYLFTDYLFESMSIVLIFELMMYADITYSKKNRVVNHE